MNVSGITVHLKFLKFEMLRYGCVDSKIEEDTDP
jgi:hypothetical protein